jgi:glycosyltransferase involved in cell wall biosynthesis
MPEPYLSVILPCYNEEEAVGSVIAGVKAALDPLPYSYEIIVVDDASTDQTAAIAEAQGVRLVKRTVQGGSGAARKSGILEAQGEIIVMLDADGSYDPADLPALLKYFPAYDQVNGARTSEQGSLKFLRLPAKWFIKKLACYLSGKNIPDLNTGMKAFKRKLMLKYLWLIPDGFSCVTSMTLAFLVNGYAVKYLPIAYHKRIGKSKFHPLKDTTNYLFTVIRMIMYFNPLKIFLPLAFILLLLGCALAVADRIMKGHMEFSDTIIIMTALLIGMLGLIADLIVNTSKMRS